TGKLDLTDQKMVLTGVNNDPGFWNGSNYTGIAGKVRAGRNGGGWNGAGIITSMTAASSTNLLTTIAVSEAGLVGYGGHLFAGISVDYSDILVMYTYAGDANLSGAIDGDDYFSIDNGYANHLTGYHHGDFDYSGRI